MSAPIGLVRQPDGTFGLAEFFPGKLVKLTADDLPAGQIYVDVSGGEIVHIIVRPGFVTWRRDERDRRRVLSLFQTWASPDPETWPEFDLEKTERAITALHIDGRGRLWVQHSRSNRDLPDGVFLNLDLYDHEGVWLREVRLVCEGNPVSDGLHFLGDGRVLLIKSFVVARLACLGAGAGSIGEDDSDTIEIVYYRLPEVE